MKKEKAAKGREGDEKASQTKDTVIWVHLENLVSVDIIACRFLSRR
ncbi:hypothetical protein [Geobacillus sp. TFV-3]|nr:hypothetical protein [Geobacillus sp. TFV-3]